MELLMVVSESKDNPVIFVHMEKSMEITLSGRSNKLKIA
jgi:hypothetical protein